jgi:hypothetical protein
MGEALPESRVAPACGITPKNQLFDSIKVQTVIDLTRQKYATLLVARHVAIRARICEGLVFGRGTREAPVRAESHPSKTSGLPTRPLYRSASDLTGNGRAGFGTINLCLWCGASPCHYGLSIPPDLFSSRARMAPRRSSFMTGMVR